MTGIIDASVHPFFTSDTELRSYLPESMKTRGLPGTERPWYQAPGGEYLERTYGEGYPGQGGFPASDQRQVVADVVERNGASTAVLHPLTRGNLPDWRLGSGVCAATNAWLAEKWLEDTKHGRYFRGTINVNPEDPEGAVREIKRWAGHGGMVQVGVPLQSREPYGKPQFQPIWRAAAEAGLPVAMSISAGAGIEGPPTPAGHTRTYAHYASYMPLNYFHHLSSLLLDGSFVHIPGLRFVFADGGIDILTPLIWRLDTFWRAIRDQTPWVTKAPSEYLAGHVRFCFSRLEGPLDPVIAADWMEMTGKDHLLMYASNYPFWSEAASSDLPAGLLDAQRDRILHDNAAELYRLGLNTPTEAIR